ncbi:MAG: electron transfer flavoprotein subunit alpha/FixB family protein [Acidobacteria bacterium]|nr:electron transfer flavoprotein subunit alpha/FixB family protein [Acidobacteriota bacterium]
MAKTILVFIETRESKIRKSSIEALSAARRLAPENTLAAAVLGPCDDAATLAHYGAGQVYTVNSGSLASFSADMYSAGLNAIVEMVKPDYIAGSATIFGRELFGRLAAKLGRTPASDCVEMHWNNGEIKLVRPVYSGKARSTVSFRGDPPSLFTLRPNVFPADSPDVSRSCEVSAVEMAIQAGTASVTLVEVLKPDTAELDASEAQVVVSGGRAMKGPDNFEILRKLVSVIPNAALGASRAAVDSGWIDHHYQVGQTGKVVSPQLYIACGISGAIQHLAGMSSSKCIVAVNKDPEAPIFKVADYGIVGDLFEIVPKLTEEFKKLLAS